MDPNLFAIDNQRLFEVLAGIITLSFLLERALAVVFENRWFVERYANRGLKEPITVLVAFGVCRYWDFDALSVIFVRDKTQLLGHLLTGAVIAGGSKGSVKLFHDVLNMMSSAERARQEQTKASETNAVVPTVVVAMPSSTGSAPSMAASQVTTTRPDPPTTAPRATATASRADGTEKASA